MPFKKIKRATKRASTNYTNIDFNLPLINFEGKYLPIMSETIYFPPSDQDSYVIVNRENRLDLVAESIYGNAELWWVIALANDILNPFDVPVGITVRVPDFTVVVSRLSLQQNRLV